MARILKKILLGIAALFVLIAVAVFSIGWQPINRYIEQQIIALANGQGIRLGLKETQIGFQSLHARSGEVFLPQALLLLPFQDLTVSPHWLALLIGELGVSVDATLARGTGHFRVVNSGEDTTTINSDLSNAQIAELSQFSAFGFTEGILGLKAEELKIISGKPIAGEVSIDLEKLSKPLGNQIQIMLGNFPMAVEIPPILKGSIHSKLSLGQSSIIIRSLESLSSWGTISAKGDITLDGANRLSNLHLKGEVHLTEEGHTSFRSFLPLVSQGILKLETTSFTFEISGKPPAVKTRFFDLG